MQYEKFLVREKGKISRWIPSNGFFKGQLDEARSLATREAEKAGIGYPCIVVLEDGRNFVEAYPVNEDYSPTGV